MTIVRLWGLPVSQTQVPGTSSSHLRQAESSSGAGNVSLLHVTSNPNPAFIAVFCHQSCAIFNVPTSTQGSMGPMLNPTVKLDLTSISLGASSSACLSIRTSLFFKDLILMKFSEATPSQTSSYLLNPLMLITCVTRHPCSCYVNVVLGSNHKLLEMQARTYYIGLLSPIQSPYWACTSDTLGIDSESTASSYRVQILIKNNASRHLRLILLKVYEMK